jgi:hypothetical protein
MAPSVARPTSSSLLEGSAALAVQTRDVAKNAACATN